jgi:hypothetical protein
LSGAFTEFAHAQALDPHDTVSAYALAVLGFDMLGAHAFEGAPIRDSLAMLMYHAVMSGTATPIVLRLCTQASLDVGDLTTARYCSQRALDQGVDSTWHLIRSSWLAAFHEDTFPAVALFDQALRAAHDSAARVDFVVPALQVSPHTSVSSTDTKDDSTFAAVLWSLPDGERVQWLHRRRAGETSYPDALLRAEGNRSFLSFGFWLCAFAPSRNGAALGSPSHGCGHPPDYGVVDGITAQVVKLWNPATGAPTDLIVFAVPRDALAASRTTGPSGSYNNYQFVMDFRRWDWQAMQWIDTVRRVQRAVPDDEHPPQRLGEAWTLGTPTGVSSWTLFISQPGRSGHITSDEELPLVAAPVALSDLVLGVASQGLSWPVGNEQVTLAPYGYVRHDELTHLFFQIRSDTALADTRTSISIHRIADTHVVADAAYSITFNSALRSGIQSTQREIDVSRIGKGNCQLQVRVTDAHGQVLAERAANLYIQ